MTNNDIFGGQTQVIAGEALQTLMGMPAEMVDAIVTDPPYCSGGTFRADRITTSSAKYDRRKHNRLAAFAGDSRDQRSFVTWCTLWLSECLRVARPGASLCVFSDWRQVPAMSDALQAGGWIWRGMVPWNRTAGGARPQPGRRFRQQCEYVLWGTKGKVSTAIDGGRQVVSLPGLLEGCIAWAKKQHLAEKPLPVVRTLVQICPPGGLVLDPFAGSGTTVVAALLEGRRAIGIELDPHIAAGAAVRTAQAAQTQGATG